MNDADRALALTEALPFIQRFHGRRVVVKLGGAAIESGDANAVLADVVLLHVVGVEMVLVHGGGPEVSALQRRLGMEPTFVDGLRVSDPPTVEVARMALTGKVGPQLVAAIARLGGAAVGISGEDGPTIHAHARDPRLGFVGDVAAIDTSFIDLVLRSGRIPVVASIGIGDDGAAYNINADSVAAAVAAALGAEKLVLMTDVSGVLDASGQLVSEIEASDLRKLIDSAAVTGGMIPKLEAALTALATCGTVHIIDGRRANALILELLTAGGIGTMIKGDVA